MKLQPFTKIGSVLLKTVLPLVLGVAVLVGVVAWMVGFFGEKIQATEDVVTPATATAEQRENAYEVREVEKTYVEEAVGTLKAADRTEISARVMATIEEVKVRAGQMVAEDQLLIVLDQLALETQRSQAEANRTAAEAALNRAEKDYERAVELARSRTITRETLDRVIEKVKVGRANLKHAREALAEVDVMLSYTKITAPKAGTIVDRLAEPGDTARPGEPLLILYDPSSLRLEVPVKENLAVKMKPGEELTVKIDAHNRRLKAVIDEIVPQAEAGSRSFLVKVKLPRSDDLFEGMFGRLEIPAGRRRHLCLHSGAIETVGQLQFVTVIRDDDTLERRFIKTGRRGDKDHVEVLSGLKAGDKVLLKPSCKDGVSTCPEKTVPLREGNPEQSVE